MRRCATSSCSASWSARRSAARRSARSRPTTSSKSIRFAPRSKAWRPGPRPFERSGPTLAQLDDLIDSMREAAARNDHRAEADADHSVPPCHRQGLGQPHARAHVADDAAVDLHLPDAFGHPPLAARNCRAPRRRPRRAAPRAIRIAPKPRSTATSKSRVNGSALPTARKCRALRPQGDETKAAI